MCEQRTVAAYYGPATTDLLAVCPSGVPTDGCNTSQPSARLYVTVNCLPLAGHILPICMAC
jgi:hypothetical protein